MSNGGQPPFPWRWYFALVGCAAATGVAFAAARWAGLVMACLTAAVFIGFMVWAVRVGRRRRAAGHKPDVPAMQRRIRQRLRWLLPLAILSAVASGLAVATDDNNTATWLLVAGPVLVLVGLAWTWVLSEHLLPRLQRKQEAGSDDASA